MVAAPPIETKKQLHRANKKRREHFVFQLTKMLEGPMTFLAFIWAGLVVYTLAAPMHSHLIDEAMVAIWYVFAAEFLLRAVVAPNKLTFLKKNWLAAISIVLPALRTVGVFGALMSLRVFGLFAGQSMVLLLLGSVNRSMSAASSQELRKLQSELAALRQELERGNNLCRR